MFNVQKELGKQTVNANKRLIQIAHASYLPHYNSISHTDYYKIRSSQNE